MKKEKIRAIVVKVVLAFVAVFVLMAFIGLFVPVGNAKPNSDNIEFSSDFSLLNFDASRKHQVVKMEMHFLQKTGNQLMMVACRYIT